MVDLLCYMYASLPPHHPLTTTHHHRHHHTPPPPPPTHLLRSPPLPAGVTEAVVRRVLDAFTAAAASALGASRAGQLAARPDLTIAMAAEPAGALLHDPLDFAVPK